MRVWLLVALLVSPVSQAKEPKRATPAAEAEPFEPRARVMYSNFLALRVNPLGLVERVRFSWRHRLIKNDGALFRGAWVDIGPEVTVVPTYASGGARLEVRPLSILGLSATYEFIGYFGAVGAVMPIDSPQDDYWEDTLNARDEAGDNTSAIGSRLTLSALFQIKAGPFVLRNTVTGLRVELGLPGGEDYFYDATQDLVLPNGGWAILNDLDVAGVVGKTIVGARYSYADALHGTGGPGDLPNHRVGPLVAYTFHDRPAGARFNKPTILALVQWHAQHPYRSGQEQTAAYPYVAIAFQFEGDLWTSDK